MTRLTTAFLSLFLLLFFSTQASAQLQTPDQFLGYELGERYTPHHNVLSYVRHVAEESDRVTLHTYGETYEHRELVYLVISSPANQQQIEEIRTNNLKMTGLMEGEATDLKKAIIWLSYNIHGNETSSSEAALKTLHELADPANQKAAEWLAESVVILDPMLNPDGRDRYVNWFRTMVGSEYNPDVNTREHRELWPGGRSNHYYFDLNRDWAWQVQKESQQRSEVYQQWMPHVHVDFHEQSYNAPYYFAPAAEPFHEAITDWQREFQTTIGMNNIRYFDEEGWHYFTRERFDLFYPSYGDTWPTFNGAIGMTYEQAGHGLAGAAVITQEGDTLTLNDRLTHHHITGISTIEVTAEHAERVVSEFENQFRQAAENPAGTYRSFIVNAGNHPDKIHNLLRYLDSQQIRYGRAGSSRSANGFNYQTGETERFSISEEDIIISAHQPKSQLVRVLFEPDPALSDSLTYDITAWETHYRFGLDGFATETRIDPQSELNADDLRNFEYSGAERPYAYVSEWGSMDDARFLAELIRNGVKSRFSTVPFEISGKEFGRGTLVITRDNNRRLGNDFDTIVRDAAEQHQRSIYGSSTGFVDTGSDFGSANVQFIEAPNVALFLGDGTSSLAAGEVWHFFDRQLNYPVSLFHTHHFNRTDLTGFDTIVMPGGTYSDMLNDSGEQKLSEWVRNGGNLIAIDQAVQVLSGIDGFSISRKTAALDSDNEPESALRIYEDRSREAAMNRTPGSIFRTTLDNTHPLAYGYDSDYFSLKGNATAYNYLNSGWNVGTVRENAHISGFAGVHAKENLESSLTFGVQSVGSGQVVYMVDNPLFRGFWENGKLLFANALFFVGQ
ncbi:zinc carboxypeptidase [Rhodohalobacter sp. SW132]|uniref:M14 family metallopeptidase n=1 Tax=Rhodohalobacter sp. SW132 TaxID=2293433 RepID=UPI000E250B78|nr:M14 family metallopeptidase [Rhodohalobacter sp. SW132]REL29200.1 zinc carboxypeptidase [Rhodohalobacter sp. SW132]